MPQVLTNEIIQAAIEGFESQKKRIDSQIANLKTILTGRSAESSTLAAGGSGISAAPRRRMALGQKERWAAIKKAVAPETTRSSEAPKKSRLSPAGRRAIAAAAKKRWALKKAAEPQKTKLSAAKKTVGTNTSGRMRKKAATNYAAKSRAEAPAQPGG